MIAFLPDQDQTLVRDMARHFAQDTLRHGVPEDIHTQLVNRGLWNMTGPPDSGGSQMDWPTTLLVLKEVARANASVALRLLCVELAMILLPKTAHTPPLTLLYRLPHTPDLALCLGPATPPTLAIDSQLHAWAKVPPLPLQPQPPWMGLRDLEPFTVDTSTLAWTPQDDAATSQAHDTALALGLGAVALGLGLEAKHEALEYAAARTQFGKPLTAFQATQFKLAQMATELDAAHVMVWQAAHAMDQGEPSALDLASMACHQAIEAALYAADEGLQLHGGYGYTSEYPIERLYRDTQALSTLSQRQQGLAELGQRLWQQAHP